MFNVTEKLSVRAITPSFGAHAAEEAALSGALRHSHSRLMESGEEVAFFFGEETERMLIERDYFGLIKHVNRVLRIRLWHGVVEEGIIKYVVSFWAYRRTPHHARRWLWGSFGVRYVIFILYSQHLAQLCICAIPVFFSTPGVSNSNMDLGGRTEGWW